MRTRNQHGQLTSQTAPGGGGGYQGALDELTTTFEFDSSFDLVKAIYADATEEEWTYDQTFHRMTSYTNQKDYTVTYSLDGFGNTQSVNEPAGPNVPGRTTQFEYTAAPQAISALAGGLVSLVARAQGSADESRQRSEYYDVGIHIGLLKRQIFAADSADQVDLFYTYDANRNPLTAHRRTWQCHELYLRRSRANCVAGRSRSGNGRSCIPTTIFKYDAAGNLVETKNARTDVNATTNYQYDSMDRLRLTELPNGVGETRSSIEVVRDNNSNVTETIVHNQIPLIGGGFLLQDQQSIDSYNERNELVQATDAEGNSTDFEYDVLGNLAKEIDAKGQDTRYAYDQLGRLIETIDVADGHEILEYDEIGNLTFITDPRGYEAGQAVPNGEYKTEFVYDAWNRRFKTIDAEANETIVQFDLRDNPTETIDARQNSTQYVYDKLDRQTRVIDPFANEIETKYDAAGNVEWVKDKRGTTTYFEYDNLHRQI